LQALTKVHDKIGDELDFDHAGDVVIREHAVRTPEREPIDRLLQTELLERPTEASIALLLRVERLCDSVDPSEDVYYVSVRGCDEVANRERRLQEADPFCLR
jgi:hypothetical protein